MPAVAAGWEVGEGEIEGGWGEGGKEGERALRRRVSDESCAAQSSNEEAVKMRRRCVVV